MENFLLIDFLVTRLYARSCAYISSKVIYLVSLEELGWWNYINLLMIIRKNITDTIPIIALYTFAGYRLLLNSKRFCIIN